MVRIDFNRLHFLVIDDNAHMRRMVRTMLHGFGAREVYEAEDGADGLETFNNYMPDIVITDWAMPIFDGLELTQIIRQPGANANPYVPIIMLTGHAEKKRVASARDAGVTEFLAKPISAKSLYQRIVNVIANPRPFIKTKTYFGPDRRRNVNPNYAGPERRKGGKADVIKNLRCSTKSASYRLTATTYHGPPETKYDGRRHIRRSRGHHAGKQAAQGGQRQAVASPAKTIRSRARNGRWPICRRNSASGWMPNANGWTRPAARSPPGGFTAANKEALFHAAHDIKGEAATFGYPVVAPAADSLCRLIEHTPDVTRIPLALVDQHVDAVRAIYREYVRSDAEVLAAR